MNLKKFNEINIIPFIDIMLVLLAIVLTTAVFTQQSKIKVSLPVLEQQEKLVLTDLDIKNIIVNEHNQLFINDVPTELNLLPELMALWQSNIHVNLRIDQTAEFKYFVEIVQLLKKYDLKNVNIIGINR